MIWPTADVAAIAVGWPVAFAAGVLVGWLISSRFRIQKREPDE